MNRHAALEGIARPQSMWWLLRGWGRYQVTGSERVETFRVTWLCDSFSGRSFQGF
jgi:hypothetical protein